MEGALARKGQRLKTMIACEGHNITSPLGTTSEENYSNVIEGRSALRLYDDRWNLPEPFFASMFDREKVGQEFELLRPMQRYTLFEKAAILSIHKALENSGINASSEDVLFVISSTKGNVELLESDPDNLGAGRELLGTSAALIAEFFGNHNIPLTVSNACISGVSAQIFAMRMLDSMPYKHVVVTGADVLSPFIITGFQSLKALSPEACRPFDASRCGLNLGEAAATIIFGKSDSPEKGCWTAVAGAIRNDANHISGPSRTGEGSFRALRMLERYYDKKNLACINAHGTSTLYNDEMESIAITRAGLEGVPVGSLKGYFGHTLGAAGILESILCMEAIDHHKVIGTRGFETLGVSGRISVSGSHRDTEGNSFIKMLSGFGGCNAAMLYSKMS